MMDKMGIRKVFLSAKGTMVDSTRFNSVNSKAKIDIGSPERNKQISLDRKKSIKNTYANSNTDYIEQPEIRQFKGIQTGASKDLDLENKTTAFNSYRNYASEPDVIQPETTERELVLNQQTLNYYN